MLIFPYMLVIRTPYGTVDLAGYEIPPEASAKTEERNIEVLQLLDGRGLPRVASKKTLTRLKFASPQDFALPNERASILKQLQLGDSTDITECLTNREALTIWTNALVWAAPVITRLGTDTRTNTEYYSYQLEFIHTETS